MFLITGSSPAGCGMTTVPSPDTGASFRGIISVIMTTSEVGRWTPVQCQVIHPH
ncbi:hypothetical protein ACLB1E_04270 [Escherichia coli]